MYRNKEHYADPTAGEACANIRREEKYGNRKTCAGDRVYDSAKEYRRACELHMLERAGAISSLQEQVAFELVPKGRRADGKAERAVKYVADFVYRDNDTGQTVVEDVKGVRTAEYVIKRKLMLWRYGISVVET